MCLLQNIINIQLLYDVNQATKQDLWDGNFQAISLYSVLKHLPLNSKNIKESLHCMTKYIENKKVKKNKANDVPDLSGIDKAV